MSWAPPNKYVWDSWFYWHGKELHAFYLQADKAACGFDPEARHNLASVGHAVWSAPPGKLSGWQECREALAPSHNGGWDNLSIWTGSVIKAADEQRFHLFYTSRSKEHAPLWTPSEWQRPQQIGVAVSEDLLHWQRTPASQRAPVIPNPGQRFGLDGVSWRDPYVVRLNNQQYAALICARLQPEHHGNELDAGGVVAYVTSPDLHDWNAAPQLIETPREFYQMEVPQIFWREFADGVRCYLLFCAQQRDCSPQRQARGLACVTGTYYLQSALLPHGASHIPAFHESAQLLAEGLYGGKLLKPETDETPALLGFPWADQSGHFIGGISDPLRVRFNADGTIHPVS